LLGRFAFDRPALPAVSLADHTAAMTAIGNDYGFRDVFVRQVVGLGTPGDVLVGLTTSGDSPNVVRALVEGRRRGMYTVALTGSAGGAVADVAHLCIRVPTSDTARIQEASLHLGHTICELVESAMFRDSTAVSLSGVGNADPGSAHRLPRS
jgi:D-sedoheptulose 7-phosphate isomerase